MKVVAILVAMLFAFGSSTPSFAQGRGNGQAKKTNASAPKAKPAAQHPKHTTQTAKNTTKTTTKTAAKVEARAVKAENRAAKTDAKAARKSNNLTIVTTEVTPTTPTGNSVKNRKLEQRLLTLLPAGSTIQDASMGFKNWGQFVAAAHVSNNLGIPFADLKSRMTGIPTGSTVATMAPMSLGQAIQSFKTAPTSTTNGIEEWSSSRTRREVKKAEDAANSDLRRSREGS